MTPELKLLVARAKAYVDGLTPEARAAMYEEQRRNIVRSMATEGPESTVVVLTSPALLRKQNASPAAAQPDFRHILVSFVSGLVLAEDMGDVWEDAHRALKLAGVVLPEDADDDESIADHLAIQYGAVSLWDIDRPAA